VTLWALTDRYTGHQRGRRTAYGPGKQPVIQASTATQGLSSGDSPGCHIEGFQPGYRCADCPLVQELQVTFKHRCLKCPSGQPVSALRASQSSGQSQRTGPGADSTCDKALKAGPSGSRCSKAFLSPHSQDSPLQAYGMACSRPGRAGRRDKGCRGMGSSRLQSVAWVEPQHFKQWTGERPARESRAFLY